MPGPERQPGAPSRGQSLGAARPAHVVPVALQLVADGLGLHVEGAGSAQEPAGSTGPAPALTGVTLDSRTVRPGDLYVGVQGARAHGAAFSAAAARSGAVAVLTDEAGRANASATGLPVLVVPAPRAVLGDVAAAVYGRPAERLLTVAVTGTNGKTTTAYLIEAGLRTAHHATGLLGTIETRIAGEVLPSERTTPEATDLHALLAIMVERGVTAVAMEVSSHALRLGRVGGLIADVALFTNLGRDHLDFHVDLEDYFEAKSTLFRPDRSRQAVVNLDDAYGARLAAAALVPTTTYSGAGDRRADWTAADVVTGPGGSRFTAVGPQGARQTCAVQLPGRFNVDNALGALAALVAAGVPVGLAAAGIAGCPGVPGRLERVDAGQPFLALVDYAHTPEAVETLLGAVRPLVPGRVVVVLGCGGDRDRDKRAAMGEAAARAADVVVVTDDNPRSEEPATIRAAVVAGAKAVHAGEGAEVVEIGDRRAAIDAAVAMADPAGAVVVAGKGHETGQEVAGEVVPFDDRVTLRAAIRSAMTGGDGTS